MNNNENQYQIVNDAKAEEQKQKQEAMSKWSRVPFSNRFMFRLVMENHEICKRTLELLLGIEIAELDYVEGEKSIEAKLSSKGIRLDVYIKDKKGNVFDLEMQSTDADHKALGKRTRYYQSVVDADSLRKGVAYALLPKSIILFICMYDPYGRNYVRYTFSNLCHEDKSLELGDLSNKVIINTVGNTSGFSQDVCNFLDYINTGEAKDEFTREIDAEVVLQRSDENKAVMYMTWDQEIMESEAKGVAKGDKNRMVRDVHNLMDSLNLTVEQAMQALKLTAEEQKELLPLL